MNVRYQSSIRLSSIFSHSFCVVTREINHGTKKSMLKSKHAAVKSAEARDAKALNADGEYVDCKKHAKQIQKETRQSLRRKTK